LLAPDSTMGTIDQNSPFSGAASASLRAVHAAPASPPDTGAFRCPLALAL
jgi:hypothetical protein